VYTYTPASGQWGTLASTPEVGCSDLAVATSSTGLVYAEGGTCRGFSNALYILDPASDTWTRAPGMPGTKVHGASAAFGGNGLFYVMGGVDSSLQAVTQVMAYDPATRKWAEEPSLPIASEYGAAVELPSGQVVYAGGYDVKIAGGYLNNVWELSSSK
jgi:N-acetylneuraminic acid mutarotase